MYRVTCDNYYNNSSIRPETDWRGAIICRVHSGGESPSGEITHKQREVREASQKSQADDDRTSLCFEGLMEDYPDSFDDPDDFVAAAASLNVHDYLQQDADAIFKSTFLSLRSDLAHDPLS